MDAKDLFTNLAIAAMVDGELGEKEKKLLQTKAKALKLRAEDANDVMRRVASKEITAIKKPTSAAARRKLYEEMVAIVRSDKQLTGTEQEFLRRLGNALEIDEEDMQKAISPTKKS